MLAWCPPCARSIIHYVADGAGNWQSLTRDQKAVAFEYARNVLRWLPAQLVQALVNEPVPPTGRLAKGRLPVEILAYQGGGQEVQGFKVEVTRLLLGFGAAVDGLGLAVGQGGGTTALQRACATGNPEVAEVLLEHGADPWLRSSDGQHTAVSLAGGARFFITHPPTRDPVSVSTPSRPRYA